MTEPTGHPEKTNPLDPEVDVAEDSNAVVEPDLTEPDETMPPALTDAELDALEGQEP